MDDNDATFNIYKSLTLCPLQSHKFTTSLNLYLNALQNHPHIDYLIHKIFIILKFIESTHVQPFAYFPESHPHTQLIL